MLPGVAAGGLKAACHSSPPPAAAAAACLLHNATPVRAQFCTSSRLHMWDPLIISQKYINGAVEVLVLHNARLYMVLARTTYAWFLIPILPTGPHPLDL